MAIYKNNVPGTIDSLKKYISDNVGALGFSISAEEEDEGVVGNTKYYIAGFERFGYISQNRVSLNITLLEADAGVKVIATSLGGSAGAIFKINTWSEENFLNDFADLIERYKKEGC